MKRYVSPEHSFDLQDLMASVLLRACEHVRR